MAIAELLILGHFVLNLFLGLRVIYSNRSSGSALAWLVFIFAVPYIGTITYLFIGETRLSNKRNKRSEEIQTFYSRYIEHLTNPQHYLDDYQHIDRKYSQLGKLNTSINNLRIESGNSVNFLYTADSIIEAFITDINKAQHTCLLMFYIVSAHGRVEDILEALIAASRRGVRCRLLVDSVGSSEFIKSSWPKRLKNEGILLTNALPVNMIKAFFIRGDLRNHRKLLIIDFEIGYTGSYNLVDPKKFKKNSGVGQWVDAVARCQGPIVKILTGVFYADWAVENDANLSETLTSLRIYLNAHLVKPVLSQEAGHALLQVIPSAPNDSYYVIYDTLVCAIHTAQQRIIITTPYFIPDETLLNALTTAARRGVKITLILPEKVDSWLVGKASKAYYQMLLDADIELAMFTGGLLHTKSVSIDENYALFGTVNMDMRSFYINMEISLAVYDTATIKDIVNLQNDYLKNTRPVILKKWQKRSITQRFIERCVRLISPLL